MNKPFEIERTCPVSVSRLWTALTDPEEIKNWYFKLPGFKAEVRYEFEFMGGPPGGVQYRHLCEVTEVMKEKKLVYSWRYGGYEGMSYVSWELFAEGTYSRRSRNFPKIESGSGCEEFCRRLEWYNKQFTCEVSFELKL